MLPFLGCQGNGRWEYKDDQKEGICPISLQASQCESSCPTVRALRVHTENQNSHLASFSDLNRRGVNDCRRGGSQCAYTVCYSKHEPTPEGSQTSLGDGYSEVIFKYLTKQPFFIHEVTSKLLFRGSPTEQNNFLLHLHFYNILFMTTL